MMSRPILLVEDDTGSRYMMSEMIEELGQSCIFAKNGVEAVREFNRNAETVRLIFMDVHMPGKSGLEALKEIRSRDTLKAVPIVVVSADPDWHSEVRAKNAGFACALPKPVRLAALREILRNYLT